MPLAVDGFGPDDIVLHGPIPPMEVEGAIVRSTETAVHPKSRAHAVSSSARGPVRDPWRRPQGPAQAGVEARLPEEGGVLIAQDPQRVLVVPWSVAATSDRGSTRAGSEPAGPPSALRT